jgi:transcriptional regulator with XRE-family HTH domain
MAKRIPPTHPRARHQIEALSQRLRAARMRRSMTQEVMAERVGVSVPTIAKLESGDPSTSLATVLRALTVLGLAGDIDLIAAQDTLGRELQDNALRRTNAPLRARTTPMPRPTPIAQTPPAPALFPTPSVSTKTPRPRKPKP